METGNEANLQYGKVGMTSLDSSLSLPMFAVRNVGLTHFLYNSKSHSRFSVLQAMKPPGVGGDGKQGWDVPRIVFGLPSRWFYSLGFGRRWV